MNTELWCSGLTCLPVTQEIASSTLVSSAIFFATVAQLVEQRTENPRVVGSIPTRGTSYNKPSGVYFFLSRLAFGHILFIRLTRRILLSHNNFLGQIKFISNFTGF